MRKTNTNESVDYASPHQPSRIMPELSQSNPEMSPQSIPIERALVTGASSGIGREIARILAAQGCNLVLCARRRAELEALAAELADKHGVQSEVVVSNLASVGGVKALIATAGEVDIVVNNAGFGFAGSTIERDTDGQLSMIDLNVRALTHLSRHYGKKMAGKGRGRILNVASIAAFTPGPGMAVYCATKAYVLSFSRALHDELRPKGVSVTALCPGFVETGFQEVAGLDFGAMERSTAVSAEKVAEIAVKAMRKGRREVIPGLMNKPLPLITRLAPVRLQLAVAKALLG